MTYEWSHWITCHNDECEKYQCMKKRNQYYLEKSWKYKSQNEKLMICKWSHWITCHNDECEEHYRMKKWNQYYSWEFWKCISQDERKWSKKSLYEISIKK